MPEGFIRVVPGWGSSGMVYVVDDLSREDLRHVSKPLDNLHENVGDMLAGPALLWAAVCSRRVFLDQLGEKLKVLREFFDVLREVTDLLPEEADVVKQVHVSRVKRDV